MQKFKSIPEFISEGTSLRSLQTSLLTFCLRYDTDQVKSLTITNENVTSSPTLKISSLYTVNILSLTSYVHPIEVQLNYCYSSIPVGISPCRLFNLLWSSVILSNIVRSVQLSNGELKLKSSGCCAITLVQNLATSGCTTGVITCTGICWCAFFVATCQGTQGLAMLLATLTFVVLLTDQNFTVFMTY